MSAERASHIQRNIDFAFSENRALHALMAEAQKTDGAVNFIAQKAGAILQATRECFDYCAADIRDDLIPGEGRTAYFPFHPDTLGKGRPLYPLQATHPSLYGCLLEIANKMQTATTIPGTSCSYSDLRAVNNLVNSKKHDRIKEVCEVHNSMTRIEIPGGASVTVSPIYPVGPDGVVDRSQPSPVGPGAWVGAPGVRVTAVKNFLFSDPAGLSRPDVHGFCMTSITATRFVLGKVYGVAYGMPENVFHEKA